MLTKAYTAIEGNSGNDHLKPTGKAVTTFESAFSSKKEAIKNQASQAENNLRIENNTFNNTENPSPGRLHDKSLDT